MAHIKKTPYGTFQICIRNRLLPKALWATFDTEEQAANYATQLEGLLAQGYCQLTAAAPQSAKFCKVWG